MPLDPDIYGQRPHKKRKHTNLSGSLDFAAQLTSHIAGHSATGGGDGARDSADANTQRQILTSSKKLKLQSTQDLRPSNILKLKPTPTTDDADIARSRAKMEEKARKYAAMKRGDYVPGDGQCLVDFDRKWAEAEQKREGGGVDHDSNSDSDDQEDADDEIFEFEDEFGRLRRGTRSEKERMERRMQRGALGAEELDRMSARPAAPNKLLYGDVIQSLAFNPEDPLKMEELARNRDRSPTPPPQTHYDASKEIRTKGVGFYKFSQDKDVRAEEMRSLDSARQETDLQRQERADRVLSRRQEMEQRRKDLDARRAKKLADSFLDS